MTTKTLSTMVKALSLSKGTKDTKTADPDALGEVPTSRERLKRKHVGATL